MKKIVVYIIILILFRYSVFGIQKIEAEKFEICKIEKGFSGHSSPTISKDFKEMYWSEYDETKKTMVIKYKIKNNGMWQKAGITGFSGKYWDDAPYFSPDNKRIYFASKRPTKTNLNKNDMDIWYTKRTKKGWSNPINLTFNTRLNEGGPTIASNGNIYYSCYYSDSKGDMDLYFVRFKDGKYGKPQNLGIINTKHSEFTPYISPDENLLIFSTYNRPEGNGLFISEKDQNGNWQKPYYIDKWINMKLFKRFPMITPNKKSLILSTKDGYYKLNFNKIIFIKERKSK